MSKAILNKQKFLYLKFAGEKKYWKNGENTGKVRVRKSGNPGNINGQKKITYSRLIIVKNCDTRTDHDCGCTLN